MVKSLRTQCIELLTEIEARLDFDDEMPPLDMNLMMSKINAMSQDVENAMETATYDKFLQSGLQVCVKHIYVPKSLAHVITLALGKMPTLDHLLVSLLYLSLLSSCRVVRYTIALHI